MLTVSNLKAAYGQSEVIHGLSFSVAPKETLAIMGRNGMGKSTLFKSLMGVLMPTGGSIDVAGVEVSGAPSYKRVVHGLAYVPQGRMVFGSMTVEENILTGLETRTHKVIPENIYTLFPVLYEMKRRKAGNLSGGQQQQLAIARALVSDPKVLLLDEPTEGIQPSIIKDIAGIINQIKQTRNIAIVVSEQVLSFALDVADRLLVIDKGKFVHEDSRAAVDAAQVARYLSV